MSKITKLLVLLLALVMVVSLFAGCKPAEDETKNTTTEPTKGTESGDNQTTASTTIENSMFPLEEPYTFRMAVRGNKNYQELMEKCEWYKYLCEKTNVFIEVVVLGDDYKGTLNTLITANNPPDVVLGPTTLGSNEIVELSAQGKLVALEEYLTDKSIMPNYNKLLEAVPQALGKGVTPDGHIYSVVSTSVSPGTGWESPFCVNIEWLKQVPGYEDGKTFPKDVEAFTEVLRYFKENDMNGNGDKTDEVPLLIVSTSTSGDTQATMQGMLQMWGLSVKDSTNDYYVHIEDDGTIKLAPQTENFRDAMEWFNIWYEEGLLWDNFFTKVSSSELYSIYYPETDYWGFCNASPWINNGPDADNGTIPWRDAQTLCEPFDTGYEVHYFLNPGVTGTTNCFTMFNSCDKPEVVLAWYDQFLTASGSLTAYSGMPNEWELWDDSADYKAYYEKNPTWYVDEETGMNKYPSYEQEDWVSMDAELAEQRKADHPFWAEIFSNNAVFKGLTPDDFINGNWEPGDYSEAVVLGTWIEEHPEYFDHAVWPRPYSTADEAEEISFLWPDVRAVMTKYETGFISGTIELNDANWEAFQEEMEDAGIDDLVEILQAMYDRTLVD